MRSSKTLRKSSNVALAVSHAAPSCWNQMLPISSSSIFVNKKFVQFGPITTAIDCSCSFLKKNCPIMSGAKSASNSDSFWVHWLFNACVQVFCATNATILLVYITAKIKRSFIWKDEFFFFFFFAKIGIFCKLIAGLLPSVVQTGG